MICTFFGHKDTPESTKEALKSVLINLIENKGVNLFYVGNHGNFDRMTLEVLKELTKCYSHIKYYVVLAYFPKNKSEEHTNTILTEGLESTPPKYAIIKRNQWMIDKSDFVVTYVKYTFGGAYKFQQLAIKKGKTVIDLV